LAKGWTNEPNKRINLTQRFVLGAQSESPAKNRTKRERKDRKKRQKRKKNEEELKNGKSLRWGPSTFCKESTTPEGARIDKTFGRTFPSPHRGENYKRSPPFLSGGEKRQAASKRPLYGLKRTTLCAIHAPAKRSASLGGGGRMETRANIRRRRKFAKKLKQRLKKGREFPGEGQENELLKG